MRKWPMRKWPRQKWMGRAAVAAVLMAAVAGCGTDVGGTAVANSAAVIATSSADASSSAPATSGADQTDAAPSPTAASEPSTAPAPSAEPTDSVTEPSAPSPTGSSEPPATSGSSTTGTQVDLYPTTPRAIPEYPQSEGSAGALEGRRLATYTLNPTLFDGSYSDGGGFSTLPLRGPSALGILFSGGTMETVAERAGMMAGFSSARSTKDDDEMIVALLEFPSADAAAKAVPLLAAAAKSKEQDHQKAVVVGYPKAQGWTGAYDSLDSRYAHAFLADGNTVIYLWLTTTIHSDKFLQGMMPKIYAAQIAKLKTFQPMAADGLMKQKLDPDGMLARTLPSEPDNATVIDGVYTGDGMLHYMINPADDQPLFAKAGIDRVSTAGSSVYRTKDASAAKTVVDTFLAETQQYDSSYKPMAAPDGADYAKCLQNSLAAQYYCTAQYGRYAVELRAETEKELATAVSAQGKLLAGF